MDHQEQTTLDPMEAHQQAEEYRQSDGQQYDQSNWHQHEDATQALQNLAQEFRYSKNRQLLPAPTNNPTSQNIPQFSYEAASLHGLYVPLPSYLPPHQQPYDTSFIVSPLPLPIQDQHPLISHQQTTYAWPQPHVSHPERKLPPLPLDLPIPPSIQIPGPLPEELRLSPFPGSVLPLSGTIWPPPPAGLIEALHPDEDYGRQWNQQIDWDVSCRLNSVLAIGNPDWAREGYESLGEGIAD